MLMACFLKAERNERLFYSDYLCYCENFCLVLPILRKVIYNKEEKNLHWTMGGVTPVSAATGRQEKL